MAFSYPVALELQGRRCVVVGPAAAVEGKVGGLLAAGAEVVVVAPDPGPGLERLAAEGRLHLIRRPYAPGDLTGAFLALVAGCDRATTAAVFAEAETGRVLLNAMDDTEHCHFALPAVLRRGDLVLTISTGGRAPALAKRLRLELAEQFGPEWGRLVELLGTVREEVIGARQVDFGTWAARWATALDHDLAGLLRAGRTHEAEELVRRCLVEGGPPATVGNGLPALWPPATDQARPALAQR